MTPTHSTHSTQSRIRRLTHYVRCKLLWVVPVLLAVAACESETQYWQRVDNDGTAEAYGKFLDRFPNGEFSVHAAQQFRKQLNQLHLQAVESIKKKDYKTATRIYDRILESDENNALAINNKVWIRYKDQPGPDFSLLNELAEQLTLAQGLANRRRISREQYSVVTSRGRLLSIGRPLVANQHGLLEPNSIALRSLVDKNLDIINDVLGSATKKAPPSKDLLIKGHIVNQDGHSQAGNYITVLEGKVSAVTDSEGLRDVEIFKVFGRNSMLINPKSVTDEDGHFEIILRNKNISLDPFSNKILIFVASNTKLGTKNYGRMLMENDRPFIFQAELDRDEMNFGKLTLHSDN